jgi:hypothetical protein
MLHPISAEEVAVLNALLASGTGKARDVAGELAGHVRTVMRSMELREPALVSCRHEDGEEVWRPTADALRALEREQP